MKTKESQIKRACEYIYNLYTKPVAIQKADVLQLFQILNGFDDDQKECIITILHKRVDTQLWREYLIKKYGASYKPVNSKKGVIA